MPRTTSQSVTNRREVSNTRELRLFNKMRIVDLLRSREIISKAEIAKELNLSFATASNLCNELIDENIFITGLKSAQSGGRPSELLALNVNARISFCIDFTYKNEVRLLLIDLHNKPLIEERISYLSHSNIQDLVSVCVKGFHELLQQAEINHEQLLGATLVIPGLYDKQTGGVVNSTLPILDNYNLATVISNQINLPVYIENDANLAALAVSMQGESQRYDNVLFLYIGEGLGLGILSHSGSIFHGVRGFAGEIAHIPLGHSDYECYCGNSGCVEGVLSNSGIERELMNQENPAEVIGSSLGKVVSILVNLMDPQAVFIGGEKEEILREVLPFVHQETQKRVLLQRYRDIPINLSSGVHDLFYKGASELLIRKWLMK
ncbi:ROK family protein [Paenibacillus wynnii]|uniref:ROK family transcriptional regulator n=1 Tax=Paenibacillus wynnii TaxID=268407 RepID=A0A098MB48_9BACL|nr:ROK family protein [Paenibacillus wynnii]KGE18757.1 hypothetical protein PWYN_04760 [Paenibacillus wynnii]